MGSSANITVGRDTSARATATRCCWPPDISLGRWLSRSPRPTFAMSCVVPVRLRLAAGDLHRQEDVLLRGEHRQEVEELEDEADVVPAQGREAGVVEAGDLGVADPDLPAVGVVQPREDVHERRLARARRPHDGRQPPGRHVEVHAAQGVARPSRPRRSAARRPGRARPRRVGSGGSRAPAGSAMPWGPPRAARSADVVSGSHRAADRRPGTSGEPPDRDPEPGTERTGSGRPEVADADRRRARGDVARQPRERVVGRRGLHVPPDPVGPEGAGPDGGAVRAAGSRTP